MPAARILAVEDEAGVRRCHPVVAQLRPHIPTADELVERWQRQRAEGYRMVALEAEEGEGGEAGKGGRIVAVAGYRVQENLVYGRFLYVDDLVTDAATRGNGHGEQLMDHLKQQAQALGCPRLVLDTPMANALGQRFYFRNGLLATALRFGIPIPPAA